jgi:hypothetical protein
MVINWHVFFDSLRYIAVAEIPVLGLDFASHSTSPFT